MMSTQLIGPRFALASLFFVASVTACSVGFAQLTDSSRSRLSQAISDADTEIDVTSFPDLQQARADLKSAIGDARAFFSRATDADNYAAWMLYLDVDELEQAIESEEDLKLQGRLTGALLQRLVGTAPGLELSRLLRLRTAAENFFAAALFNDGPAAAKKIGVYLAALSKTVESTDSVPTAEDAAYITRILGELTKANQASVVTQSVRNTFSHSNVSLSVSERFLQRLATRSVNQSQQVRDCILGTRLVGSATMQGWVTADFQPCASAAKIQLALNGQFCSNNTGYNGPISLQTVGSANVNATRNLFVNQTGIAKQPVHVHADLQTQITSINHPLRLVRRIAANKAAQQKPQADRIAHRKLTERVGQQFTTETDQATVFSVSGVMSQVTPMLRRLSLPEPSQGWSSTSDDMSIGLMFRRKHQIGAVNPSPWISTDYSAAIQLHESLIANVSSTVLAGRTMTKTKIDELLSAAGREPAPADDEAEASDFVIDFDPVRPLIFEARDGLLTLGIRAKRFAQDGKEVKVSRNFPVLTVSANYKPSATDSGRQILVRDGDVNVTFGQEGKLPIDKTAAKGRMIAAFSKVFPTTLLDKPIVVPADAKMEALRGTEFTPSEIDANDGWLTIAVR